MAIKKNSPSLKFETDTSVFSNATPEAPNQVIALKPVNFDPTLPTPPKLAETAANPASPFLLPLPLGYANYPL